MIKANNQKLSDEKIGEKVGGLANESRFGGPERELRKRKSIVVPSVNTNGVLKLFQGWNGRAIKKDVLLLKINNEAIIVKREDIEQALAYMSQGDELMKYVQPIIKTKQ